MDVWTITTILIGAVTLALLLAYILRSRSTDHYVWEDLPESDEGDSKASAVPSLAENSENSFARAGDLSRQGVQIMSSPNSASSTLREHELRRSSRVEQPVQLIVLGTNRHGEPFQERTAAVSFNLHGCRYTSRHEAPRESWVTLQVTGTDGAAAPAVRARVCSVQSPQSPREMCQIGVELETPANIWGVTPPPEDWQRWLGPGAEARSAQAATAAAPALDPSAPPPSFMQRPAASERRAEVTVFPGPVAPESAAMKEDTAKSEQVTFTAEQLLQALQGKLQIAAQHAVETALAEQLDQTVQQALAKMDEGWKANVRQTEEFSAARLSEVQNRWERELVVYRSRAEEISRRVETLGTSGRQALTELQKFADRIQNEIQPQFTTHVEQSLARATADLESKAGEHKASIAQTIQANTMEARAQLEEILGEARSLLSAAKEPSTAGGVSEERLESLLNSSREAVLNRTEERLSDTWMQFEQQQDFTRRRCDELTQHLEMLSTQLNEAKALNERALEEMRSTFGTMSASVLSQEKVDSSINATKEHIFNHLEWRLGEVAGRSDQQHNAVQQRADELFRRIDGVAADSANARSQSEQSTAELRGMLANAGGGLTQQHLDGVVNSVREQLMNHLEWRLGEVSALFVQQHDAMRQRSEELSQHFEAVSAELRGQLDADHATTESLVHDLHPQDEAMEHSMDRASKDFEASAARISDRQLVRLMQQKQALSAEASLELEARASETRALLQKAANSMLEDFGRRFESHIDLVIAEANERVASSLASLDAESRAGWEMRRRDMELQIARAAEQSTAEFRSGIKAFLYSCLVAAVSGVDEHAQSTLASLAKDVIPASVNSIADSASGAASNGTPHSGEPHT